MRGGLGEPHVHPAQVGAVPPAAVGGLEHHRAAQLPRHGHRVVGRPHPAERRHDHPDAAQQRVGLLVGEQRARAGVDRRDERACRLDVDAGRDDEVADRPRAPLRVAHRTREREHRALGARVRRDAAALRTAVLAVVDGEHLGHALRGEERRDHRLLRAAHRVGEGPGVVGGVGGHGGDVDDDEGVALVVGEEVGHRRAQLLGAAGRPQVDGVPGEEQALGEHDVRGQHAQRRGVADDPDPRARRQGLVGEQLGGVEELVDRVDPDHPGLVEHGAHGGLVDGLRAAREARRGGDVAPALHRDHGLLPGEPTRDPGELARVAEGLEVEQDDVGVGVGVPVLHEVVARQVGAVAS